MRRLVFGITLVALMVCAIGCSSIQFNVTEPKAARWSWKNNFIFWGSWESAKKARPLPAVVTMNTRSTAIAKISDIPMHQGVTVYARLKTFGGSPFTKAGMVPIQITDQDIQDVERGNVVRIVVVDPKKPFQTSRFVQLRLSPTEDALKRGEEIGKPLVLVVLGNRDPKYWDMGTWGKKASSY